jgi:hypothetical protein
VSSVQVVNSVWNGSGYIKRKVADYYAGEGRAEWIGSGQLRLVMSHPKNIAAAERAAKAYTSATFNGDGRRPSTMTVIGPRSKKSHNDRVCREWPQPSVAAAPSLVRTWRGEELNRWDEFGSRGAEDRCFSGSHKLQTSSNMISAIADHARRSARIGAARATDI